MFSLPLLPKLVIGDLEVCLPIIQGGMGVGISLSSLASAVANEGGIGVISAAIIKGAAVDGLRSDSLEARLESLRREIRQARRLTKGAVGVNILVALTEYEEYFQLSVEEGVDCVFLGAGLPLKLPSIVSDAGVEPLHTKLIPIVSSGRAAQLILRTWEKRYGRAPDAFVVEGPLAGGHLGFKPEQLDDPAFALENLLADVLAVVKLHQERLGRPIPVIAAGGIYSGWDIDRFLELGAAGVQMATRFVTTFECDANLEFKQAYLKATQEDIIIIKSPLGLPGRVINNAFLQAAERGEKAPRNCSWKCMKACDQRFARYCIAQALENARHGKLKHGFAFAGANAYRAKMLVSVKELIQSLVLEYHVAYIERIMRGVFETMRLKQPIFEPEGGRG